MKKIMNGAVTMRRKDRGITDIAEIESIICQCKTCHLSMVDNGHPYVVPLSYAYEMQENTLVLYFHSANEGRKLEILRNNSEVCFEICREGELLYTAETPCASSYYFSSVLGFGNVKFIDDITEKCSTLAILMKQQADVLCSFTKAQASSVCVFKLETKDFTGKRNQRHY